MMPSSKPRICILPGAEGHTTGRYFMSAAALAGYQVDVHEGGRRIARPDSCDLLLYVDPGPAVFPLDIDRVRGVRIAYLIDVHQDLKSRLQLAPLFHQVFVAQKDYVEKFHERGFSNARWLPLACDPLVHRSPAVERDIEVGFVGKLGTPGSRRHEVLSTVLARFKTNEFERFATPREMGAIYGRSKIVFNCSINGDVNMRVFEALAAGALLVTDRIENGLSELFIEGEHYLGYSTTDEAIERIRHFLDHDEERRRIAAAGQALALKEHTYGARFSVIEQAAGQIRETATAQVQDHNRALTYARILESRRDPRGIIALMGESGARPELAACLLRAAARVVNTRLPLTPGALRARLSR